MSIQNAGTIIRLARKAAGLTQEQLSEGICSAVLLSKIENGAKGASASIFETLMSRAGKSTKAIPYFLNRTDFECFYSLKRAHHYISTWQLQKAYDELNFVELHHWANNRLHHAEWLLLHAKIQFYSGTGNHEHNYQLLLQCLSITNPNLSVSTLSYCLLSMNEIEALIMLAHEALYTEKMEISASICHHLIQYIEKAAFSHRDKARLLAETNIVFIKYLLANTQFESACQLAESSRHKTVHLHIDMPLLQLTFLHAICLYNLGSIDESVHLMKVTLYSAHAIKSCYATICTQYIRNQFTDLSINELFPLEDIPLLYFDEKQAISCERFSDGTFKLHSPEAFSIGKLIHQLRTEKNLSQHTLCRGLCSIAKLSKIEKNQQQADILLLEALLQRLGISERPFSFWGTEEENRFHDLKFKSIHAQQLQPDSLCVYIEEMESLTTEKDILQKQFILLRKAFLCPTPEEQLAMLFDALHCTIPDFSIEHILEYRLSWAELSCLNNIARIYSKTNMALESFHYFDQLFSYYKNTSPDVLLDASTYALTRNMYCHSLYTHKYYDNIVQTFDDSNPRWSDSPINSLASHLFYYSQALGECNQLKTATQIGSYACAMEYLMFLDRNATALKKYLYDDFSILLNI